MSDNDPTVREAVSFIIVVTSGGVCSVLATFVARRLFPRHVYWGRIILLSLFLALALALYLPSTAVAFSGNRDRWYRNYMDMRGMGTAYGLCTFLIWPVLAFLQFTKKTHRENND